MFTGIVEETGKIQFVTDRKVVIKCQKILEDAKIGDSIAVNGVCLTITDINKDTFSADISPETFKVACKLNLGNTVNLERAMLANGRFGGHIVSGHVDGVAKIVELKNNGDFYDLKLELSENEAKYVIRKGSITVNGISLTIAEVVGGLINLAIIPHTYENTCLKELKIGDFVNVEVDMMAKYIEKFLSTSDNRSRIDFDFLQRNGFC
mgnify:FL=1